MKLTRLEALATLLALLSLGLLWEYHELQLEYRLSLRELYGIWLQVDNGRDLRNLVRIR